MEKKALGRLMIAAAGILLAAGLVFLGLSIWGEPRPDWALPAGLGCVVVANLMVAVQQRKMKQ